MPVRVPFSSLLRPAFQTYDRAIGTISAIFGVLSVVLTLVIGRVPPSVVPAFIVARDLLVLFALLALCLFLLYKYARREVTVRAQLTFLSDQFGNFHSVVHHVRSVLFANYHGRQRHGALTEGELSIFTDLSNYVTQGVKETFTDYFRAQGFDIRDDLCVTVKMVVPSSPVLRNVSELLEEVPRDLREQRSRWVLTVSRDFHTRMQQTKREQGAKLYDVDGNTAFHNIVNMKQDCFVLTI